MSGGRTVQYSTAPQCCEMQIQQFVSFSNVSQFHPSDVEHGCRLDRNFIGGAPNARHLFHPAGLRLVGRALHQCQTGIGRSGPSRHADWVRGGRRGGAGGRSWGEGKVLATVSPTLRFHLDQLIPDLRKSKEMMSFPEKDETLRGDVEERWTCQWQLPAHCEFSHFVLRSCRSTLSASGLFLVHIRDIRPNKVWSPCPSSSDLSLQEFSLCLHLLLQWHIQWC